MSKKAHWSSIKVMQTRTRSPAESYDPLPPWGQRRLFPHQLCQRHVHEACSLSLRWRWLHQADWHVPDELYFRPSLSVPINKTVIELNCISASRATSIPVTMALPELAGAPVWGLHSCFGFSLSSCTSKGCESLTGRSTEDTNLIKGSCPCRAMIDCLILSRQHRTLSSSQLKFSDHEYLCIQYQIQQRVKLHQN